MNHDNQQANQALTPQPLIHVKEMGPAITFYEGLGGTVLRGSRDGDRALTQIADSQISPLAHPPNPDQDEGTVELNLEARAPLEQIIEHLQAIELHPNAPIAAQDFGRQLQISAPDGLLIKINQLNDGI
jgi:hypothetical protein